MSAPFERTFRSLHADRWPRWEHALLAALGLLWVWLAWALWAGVTLRVVSVQARVQARDASHRVVSEVDGALLAISAAVGEPVSAGQVLFRVDDAAPRLAHAAADAEREALILRLNHIDERVQRQRALIDALSRANRAGIQEDEALLRGGVAVAALSERDASAAAQLAEQGALSARDKAAAESASAASSSEVAALRGAAARLQDERASALLSAQSELDGLLAEQARLEGELMAAEARLQQLLEQLAHHEILAPMDGILASVAELVPGARVRVGQELASVVAPAALVVIAEVDSATALGRVAVGQPARVQLHGFSRVAFGTLPAVVERVASEPREGSLRVELALVEDSGSTIPLQHGMSGVAEIDVERVSPAELLLRASGRLLGEPPP